MVNSYIRRTMCIILISLAIYYSSQCTLPELTYKGIVSRYEQDGAHIHAIDVNAQDNTTLISYCSPTFPVKVWKPSQSEPIALPTSHVNAVAINPRNTTQIAVGRNDFTVEFMEWYNNNPSLCQAFTCHEQHVSAVIFDPRLTWAYSAGMDGKIVRYYFDNFSMAQAHQFAQHHRPIQYMCLSPDGNYIVTGSANNKIHIWYTMGRLSGVLAAEYNMNILLNDFNNSSCMPRQITVLKFSPNGDYLIVGSSTGATVLLSFLRACKCDFKDGWVCQPMALHNAYPYVAQINHDSSLLIVGYTNEQYQYKLALWNIKTNQSMLIHDLENLSLENQKVKAFLFSADGRTLSAILSHGAIATWKIKRALH